MDQGYQWLESVAKRMKDAIANGAAPTPEQVTIRKLINQFGFERRSDGINRHIQNGLEKSKLSTEPDFAFGWIDSPITIRLDSDAMDTPVPHSPPDPTHRIRSLEAANKSPLSVKPDAQLNMATTRMQLHDYSQLPVMSSEYNVVGMISWKSIGAHLSLGKQCEFVRECMESAEEVPDTTPLLKAMATIAEHGYVLVRGGDKKINGIVTATDLSFQFRQLAGPFLYIGEIEGHLRYLIHGKFTLEQLKGASVSEEGRPIEGSGDMTLGGYCRLLENTDNWGQLGLNIDRAEFIKHLNVVREIRNNVMHFNPDGPSEDETKKLRDVAHFFENLVLIGAI